VLRVAAIDRVVPLSGRDWAGLRALFAVGDESCEAFSVKPSFDSRFVRNLPGDPETENHLRQVLGACYSRVSPTPVREPQLIGFSREVSELLGIDAEELVRGPWLDVLAGNQEFDTMRPYAACYGGHQFGNWAGQLGDGRAIGLGELRGADRDLWELQLKGAGPTPYSRRADGLAVLRSSIREYLCSEAMHHLGVPTTRALSLVGTGDQVVRDMLYDGNAKPEPGAIVCRVAPSFLRFGNFEIFASRGDEITLRALTEFAIRNHFPEILSAPDVEIGAEDVASAPKMLRRSFARFVCAQPRWWSIGCAWDSCTGS